jgi:hypothetical protein
VLCAGDTVVLEYMQRGQPVGGPDAFPVLRVASVMQARAPRPPAAHACASKHSEHAPPGP